MNWLAIKGDRVVNVIVWDGISPYDPGDGIELVPSDDTPGVGIGWTRNADGTWTAPVVETEEWGTDNAS